ncbi:uncharacterized protein LOC141677759 isoform X2 [Apium graveolens]|uniref:uncharacterized protein LOC141677759 isoform X2 n=1 Tax=Apium graveolens TaxID=4045 RepID=UPI003D7961CE
MASSSHPLLNEAGCPDQDNDVDVSLSRNDQCFLEGGNDEKQHSGEHDEDEDEDDDFDFNPFLKETLSVEASSSLSSEIEGVEADVVDSGVENCLLSVTALLSKPASQVKDYSVGDGENGREVFVQASVASDDANKAERAGVFLDKKSILVSGLEIDSVTEKDGGSKFGKVVNNVLVGDLDTGLQSTSVIMDVDDEDAICRRTRARYSLASFTLDELETFLQETDDEEDLPNVDDEAEYRKFLAAVLHGGDADHVADKENENIEDEDEDEDNDADFELEIEEALESDGDEILKSPAQVQSSERGGRRPETRQNKRQKSSAQPKKKSSEHLNMPLRPLLPNVPVLPSTSIQGNLMMLDSAPCRQMSSAHESTLNGFTPHQIGQLHCLIHEHVQLLIQVYSLCIFEPSKGKIATQIQQLILDILKKRDQVLTWRTAPYPSSYFFPPYICPSVSNDCKISLPTRNASPSSMNASERDSFPENNITLPSDSGRHKSLSCSKEGQLQGTEAPMWMPYINGHVLSILDVAPLNLVKSYMDEVSSAVQEYQRRRVGDACDTRFEKEPLFPLKTLHFSADEVQRRSEAVSGKPSSGNDQGPKMTLAGTLAERSKKQSVAPVPKQIAKLAQRFFFQFNPALFPHKPSPASVVNRVLFTDAEDMLLASGLMEYNTDWKLIQQCFLPCKSKHQIFVRQKNRSCSRAPENPIKAVRRLKTSPLTAEEIAHIREGLVVFKNDLMSVWKFVVPYRDPMLLRRQWRVATGTQKSYKVDEQKKKKRRLYESNRRKGKPANPMKWHSSSEKEDCSAGEENNSGNDCIDNENEAYVHEAFLADWRPDTSVVSLELPTSNCGAESIPSYFSLQESCRNKGQSNSTGFRDLQCQIVQQFSESLKHSQFLASSDDTQAKSASSSHLNYPLPDVLLKSFASQPSSSKYQPRRCRRPRLVKLAPGLPPVNLPPSVRVMSKSAFKTYQGDTSSNVSSSQSGFAGPSTPNTVSEHLTVAQSGTIDLTKSGHTRIPLQSSISHLHPKESTLRNRGTIEDQDGSDLHMHPLLFRTPEDRRLPYYPLNCSTNASSSFNFFPRSQPLLNLSLFHNPKQANYTVIQSGKPSNSIEKRSYGIDFHPLLQRSSDLNSSSLSACPVAEQSHPAELSGIQHAQSQKSVDAAVSNAVPVSILNIPLNPSRKVNELDLDIHLSCTSTKQISADSRNVIKENMMREAPSAHVLGINDIQDTTNLKKYPDGSFPEAIPPVIGPNVGSVAHARNACREVAHNTPNQLLSEIVMEQEELSDSEDEITEDVQFECEEMTDSEGEEASDSEHMDSRGIKVCDIVVNKVAMGGDSKNEQLESRSHNEADHNTSFNKQTLRIEDHKKDKRTSSLCLNLNSCPPSQAIKSKQHAVSRNPRRGGKNKLGSSLNRSCNKLVSSPHDVSTTQQLNMNSVVSIGRRTRKGAHSSSSSLYVDQNGSCGIVMPVGIYNHVNNWDCHDPPIP